VHRAAAVNNPPLDKAVVATVNSRPLDKAVGAAAVNKAPHRAVGAVAVVKQVAVEGAAAVAAVKPTLPRQALETFARCFTTGAGIWACCAAKRKSI
jgi:hypothetical protein